MDVLPLRAANRYRFTVVLDGVDVGVRCWWSERLGAMYLDLLDGSGASVARSLRLTPGSVLGPVPAPGGLYPGRLVAFGPDPYRLAQVGSAVTLVYVTAAEVAALEAG